MHPGCDDYCGTRQGQGHVWIEHDGHGNGSIDFGGSHGMMHYTQAHAADYRTLLKSHGPLSYVAPQLTCLVCHSAVHLSGRAPATGAANPGVAELGGRERQAHSEAEFDGQFLHPLSISSSGLLLPSHAPQPLDPVVPASPACVPYCCLNAIAAGSKVPALDAIRWH